MAANLIEPMKNIGKAAKHIDFIQNIGIADKLIEFIKKWNCSKFVKMRKLMALLFTFYEYIFSVSTYK